ncbi:hypothetical protein [Dickeya fangzhongdai]|uniref:Uncharacterized protein n=1 Tax=Dickeya fangzhongdai TaxID=1778540 RepID=A0A2K8QPK2_9GAMM|nr:hypothetical protein [Dickeya fangzhongdai]ATZ94660.1 hypothetical protein CVE23_12145 [Dickeya fangzhongdai]QOH48101.1 hypothetical protein DYD82_12210 [Dickeya fangzhongdai]QOH52402.1 hypothetical protein DYD83_12205 [Dickeya fangzhongdai]WOY00393.1 hypothetical protein OGM22_00690 [Dickeya fangzhongdai]WOY04456.1 hypothetical protein OGM21_21935 [Dickeya fangzhongdai]
MDKLIDVFSTKPGYIDFIEGYLTVYNDDGLSGYITLDNGDDKIRIILSINFIDKIMKEDDVFGVLVGGRFLYCNMRVWLKKVSLLYENDSVVIDMIEEIKLLEGDLEKTIIF